jgi:hypothetical protein
MNGTSKQTSGTARKAKRINRLRAKGKTWESISIEEGIIKENGSPDPGLAYRIAHGYEPKGRELRSRLGLRDVCMSCLRGFRKKSSEIARALPAWASWWKSLPKDEKDRRIRDQYEKEQR